MMLVARASDWKFRPVSERVIRWNQGVVICDRGRRHIDSWRTEERRLLQSRCPLHLNLSDHVDWALKEVILFFVVKKERWRYHSDHRRAVDLSDRRTHSSGWATKGAALSFSCCHCLAKHFADNVSNVPLIHGAIALNLDRLPAGTFVHLLADMRPVIDCLLLHKTASVFVLFVTKEVGKGAEQRASSTTALCDNLGILLGFLSSLKLLVLRVVLDEVVVCILEHVVLVVRVHIQGASCTGLCGFKSWTEMRQVVYLTLYLPSSEFNPCTLVAEIIAKTVTAFYIFCFLIILILKDNQMLGYCARFRGQFTKFV